MEEAVTHQNWWKDLSNDMKIYQSKKSGWSILKMEKKSRDCRSTGTENVGCISIWCKSLYNIRQKRSIKDADFVTTQFRVGLLDARIKDERIPSLYGMLGQETNGAGGMFKAFRTIPVIGQIIEDMRELCPDAWLINFTNPSGMVTEAVIKHFGWKNVSDFATCQRSQWWQNQSSLGRISAS